MGHNLTGRLGPHTRRCCAADIISAVEFDQTGQHLATGDRGGRVVLFERLSAPQVQPPMAVVGHGSKQLGECCHGGMPA